ncbi:MAG: ANTAR domain-containing protein [Proteobacteria bacterium]|nr:ANTAR domain-containing protein [Pseudomonadota bacterium]
MNSVELNNLDSVRSFSLPTPLPAVRIEVAQPASWSELISALRSLGFPVSIGRDARETAPLVRVTDGTTPLGDDRSAFIVIAKARSVEALTAAIEAGASGYFVVPIDFLSLSATICCAAVQARDLSTMSERTAKLHESLTADQTVSTVVGILMERYRFQRNEAYERLRRYSRTERRKVVEIATEIVTATEELGKTMRAIESVAREP